MKIENDNIGNEKIEDEKTEDEKNMIREDIIKEYIDHIRNISELSDEEIESILADAVGKDQELLEIIEKLLFKRKNIKEKLVQIDIVCSCDDTSEDIHDILDIFEDIEYAYLMGDIVDELEDTGYADPRRVIVDALRTILYIDSIDEDDNVFIALNEKGEKLWKQYNSEKGIVKGIEKGVEDEVEERVEK